MLTKQIIEEMAKEIINYLIENELDMDVCIYYNNKKMQSKREYDENYKLIGKPKIVIEDNVCPLDYFEYVNHEHILSMSFEGDLYQTVNYGGYRIRGFNEIFNKYGLYYELGNAWNLSAYPCDDNMKIEYTDYTDRIKTNPIYIYNGARSENAPIELINIANSWYEMSEKFSDSRNCVVGAGFKFTYNGIPYFMFAQSPWQGSISWEISKDVIEKELINVGAKDIDYEWGRID